MKKNSTTIQWFRRIALAEGISFLVLLFIAVPLKYLAHLPQMVKIVGWMHGVLFMAFLALAYEVKSLLHKNTGWMLKALVASILPAGTFVLEKQMQKAGDFNRPH